MTIKVCIVGYPATYSRSPLLHGYWIEKHGIDGSYGRENVPPEDAPAFFAGLKDRYQGCNVTAPHKELAFRSVAEADATARRLQAVNTVWFEDGRMMGGNTDAIAMWAASTKPRPAGTGGTVRAGAGRGGRGPLHRPWPAGAGRGKGVARQPHARPRRGAARSLR